MTKGVRPIRHHAIRRVGPCQHAIRSAITQPGASPWEWSKVCSPVPRPQSRWSGRRDGRGFVEVKGFRYTAPTQREVTVSLFVRLGRQAATSPGPAAPPQLNSASLQRAKLTQSIRGRGRHVWVVGAAREISRFRSPGEVLLCVSTPARRLPSIWT